MAPRCQVQRKELNRCGHPSLLKDVSGYKRAGEICSQKVLKFLNQKTLPAKEENREIMIGVSPMIAYKFVATDLLVLGERKGLLVQRVST